jgi:hypothetical protein
VAVDPATRLREVTSESARREGVVLDIRAGTASAIPLADSSVDVVLSNFGVIFAQRSRTPTSGRRLPAIVGVFVRFRQPSLVDVLVRMGLITVTVLVVVRHVLVRVLGVHVAVFGALVGVLVNVGGLVGLLVGHGVFSP